MIVSKRSSAPKATTLPELLRVKGSMLLSDYGGCRELLRSIT